MVVAILAILIGLLLPTLSGAKSAAQFIRCQANLRGIGQGVQAYGVDHHDIKVPYAWPDPSKDLGFEAASSGPFSKYRVPSTGVGEPIGLGILVAERYTVFESLLDPGRNMQEDTIIDEDKWLDATLSSGSSYLYYYREPVADRRADPPDLIERLTLERFAAEGKYALVSDIHAEPGHRFSGAFRSDERWISHPQEDRSNVVFLDGSVTSGGHEDWVIKAPAGHDERNAWFSQAHQLYGGE